MTNIDPAGLPNRRASGPDAGVAKIARSDGLREQPSSPQQAVSWQGSSQAGGDPSAGRRNHSDPAVSLSASLAKLDLGATLKATVIGFDTAQQPIIKTDQGTFILDVSAVQPPLDLKIDTQLDLRIVAVDHVIEAQLIARNNISLSPPPLLNLTLIEAASAGPLDPSGPHPNPAAPAPAQAPVQYAPQPAQTALMSGVANLPPLPLAPTRFLSLREPADMAALETPAPAALALGARETPRPAEAPAQPLPSRGDLVTARTVGDGPPYLAELEHVLRPMTTPSGNRPPPLAGLVVEAQVVLPAVPQPAKPGEAATPRLTAGQNILVKIVEVIAQGVDPGAAKPPAAGAPERNLRLYPGPAATPQAPGSRMGGEITAQETPEPLPGGEAPAKTLLLSTPLGVLRLMLPTDLAVGSHLVIELSPTATPGTQTAEAPAASQPPTARPALPLASFLEKWPAIDDILRQLSVINPTLAARVQERIALPLGNLGAAAQFFMKALGQGSGVEQWLGRDATQALARSGHEALIEALKSDLSRIARLSAETGPTDWRTLLLPIHDGRETQALPVLIRNFENEAGHDGTAGDKDKAAEKGGRVTRFVVDVSLSRLGAVQMDGMIKARSFSLIMRSEQTLGPVLRTKIRDIFSAALARNRFEGDLIFRQGLPFPLSTTAFLGDRGSAAGQAQANVAGNIYV